jgi:hypothetical protein
MKSLCTILSAFILSILILVGCSGSRSKNEPYPGYSCHESLLHYYSLCTNESLSKETFDERVRDCNAALKSQVCDREKADLLWCMGRVTPGKYNKARMICNGWVCFSKGQTKDGCDCSAFVGELRKCRMQNGLFD